MGLEIAGTRGNALPRSIVDRAVKAASPGQVDAPEATGRAVLAKSTRSEAQPSESIENDEICT